MQMQRLHPELVERMVVIDVAWTDTKGLHGAKGVTALVATGLVYQYWLVACFVVAVAVPVVGRALGDAMLNTMIGGKSRFPVEVSPISYKKLCACGLCLIVCDAGGRHSLVWLPPRPLLLARVICKVAVDETLVLSLNLPSANSCRLACLTHGGRTILQRTPQYRCFDIGTAGDPNQRCRTR
jgi:hypothetical protein